MNSDPSQQLVPIGEVVRQLSAEFPDVTHSSLRFLENEGLTQPRRTSGGHRVYSVADIERIRRIKEWQRQHLSLSDIRERLDAADRLGSHDDIARRFLDLAAAGDLSAAQRIVLELYDLGRPLDEIFQQVLNPALHELGRRWHAGEILVGQEKEISALSRDLIGDLSVRAARVPVRDGSVVAGCVEGEYHELGLRMVVGLLQEQGYAVHYLGPSVSARFLQEAVRLRRPDVVLLSATLTSHFMAIEEAVAVVRAATTSVPEHAVVVGGQIVSECREQLLALGVHVSPNGDIQTTLGEVLNLLKRAEH